MSGAANRVARCPACSRAIPADTERRWRPFCSERCKLLDFGAWLAESYRIPAVEREDDDAQPPGSATR